MKLLPVILVGIGGMIGSIARYLIAVLYTKHFPASFIPLGTFVVNIFGCLLIGIIYGLSERLHILTPNWRLFLATGICGGFTTFSAFSYENISMIQQSNYTGFAIYSIGSFVVCLLSVFAGLSLIKIV
jgi:CrcB protein